MYVCMMRSRTMWMLPQPQLRRVKRCGEGEKENEGEFTNNFVVAEGKIENCKIVKL